MLHLNIREREALIWRFVMDNNSNAVLSDEVVNTGSTTEISFGLFFFCGSMVIIASVVFPFLMI